MMTLKKATQYRDKALEVGVVEAADAFGIKAGSIRRAIQLCDKALREGNQYHTAYRHENKTFPAERQSPPPIPQWKCEEHVKYFKGFGGEEASTLLSLDEMEVLLEESYRNVETARLEAQRKERQAHHKRVAPPESGGLNIGIIGDLHEPFCLKAYLEHCQRTFEKHNVDRVVFIGDIIDNHYSSYHEADPDGMGAGRELDNAISRLKPWHDAFPNADSILGNHCRLIRRKAFSGGIPKRWVREMSDVLEVPTWNFTERVVYDGVQYIHGESGRAIKKAKDDMQSTVQGHRHTEMGVEWAFGANFKVFGMAVGCGVDAKSYAMSYGKNFKKPAIGCGVVFGGEVALNIPMTL